VLGLAALTSAQASPIGAGAGSVRATAPTAQILPVQWQNVCRERQIFRRDARGRILQYQMPMCTEVWVGRRYFRDGVYYADPGFLAPLENVLP
jgi:hypothetical protein